LLTLGGPDDESLALYDLETGKALAGAPSADTSGGRAHTMYVTRRQMYYFKRAAHVHPARKR
jgi:hypothetical protein